MLKFKYRINLQFFNDEMGGSAGEGAPIDSGPSVEGGSPAAPQPGEGEQIQGNEPPQGAGSDIEQSQSFAKRLEERTQAKLQEARQQWEAENSERYGDFDKYQKATSFFLQQAGYGNMDEMLQAIEQQELIEKASEMGVTPEYMERLQKLEAEAAEAKQLRAEKEQQEVYNQFTEKLQEYASSNEVDAEQLHEFMLENNVPDFRIAHLAMTAEQAQKKLATAKEDGIKEFLESKKAPKVEGAGGVGFVSQPPTTDFNQARLNALARIRAAREQQ